MRWNDFSCDAGMRSRFWCGLFKPILIFGCFIAATSTAMAEYIPVRCELLFTNYESVVDKFKVTMGEFENLSSTRKKQKQRFEYRVERLANLATQILDYHGTKWSYSKDSKNIIVIDADPNGSLLNQIAAAVKENISGLRFEFDPRYLHEMENAAYDPQGPRISFDSYMILHGGINASLIHELRHAYHEQLFLDKSLFYGWKPFVFVEKFKFNETYSDYMNLDETMTYAGN